MDRSRERPQPPQPPQPQPSPFDPPKEPHRITLKVLRLLRPSLNQHYPLPLPSTSSTHSLPEHNATTQYLNSLAYPSSTDNQFILSPLLTLPPAFGNAYIGETFSCCLSANNETQHPVSSVTISAEIQTPSSSQPLQIFASDERKNLGPRQSTQRIAKYDLKEEGTHVLIVTVTYIEPPKSQPQQQQQQLAAEPPNNNGEQNEQEPGHIRTFRKLYQFLAQNRMTVKTKSSQLPNNSTHAILEAQLENNGDSPISLERVFLNPRKGWKTMSLNWDEEEDGINGCGGDRGAKSTPLLQPRDTMQVAFLLHADESAAKKDDEQQQVSGERIVLGQLSIEWRAACGDRGFLSTGYLSAKRLPRS